MTSFDHTNQLACSSCGELHDADALTPFGDDLLCPTCLERETFVCYECRERYSRNEDCGDESIHLCGSCRDAYYYACSRCGRLVHEDDACYPVDSDEVYCDDCASRIAQRECVIHNYSYKPEPIFYGQGKRFFGVELEIDDGGEITENAKVLLGIANEHDDHLYCKEDGSINDGFELVSEPMTLDYHLQEMPWERICDTAIKMGYRSHQPGTCGLHVHVNRSSFGETREEQEVKIARILFFVEKHWNELLRFSRRTPRQLEQWANRYGYKDHPQEMIETVKKGCFNRYTCVNLTNYSTIEFRMWRGTLKYNTFIATLQMVAHICDVAFSYSDMELREMSWSNFVSSIREPELITYLKERDLYCNDPVESEVEI